MKLCFVSRMVCIILWTVGLCRWHHQVEARLIVQTQNTTLSVETADYFGAHLPPYNITDALLVLARQDLNVSKETDDCRFQPLPEEAFHRGNQTHAPLILFVTWGAHMDSHCRTYANAARFLFRSLGSNVTNVAAIAFGNPTAKFAFDGNPRIDPYQYITVPEMYNPKKETRILIVIPPGPRQLLQALVKSDVNAMLPVVRLSQDIGRWNRAFWSLEYVVPLYTLIGFVCCLFVLHSSFSSLAYPFRLEFIVLFKAFDKEKFGIFHCHS